MTAQPSVDEIMAQIKNNIDADGTTDTKATETAQEQAAPESADDVLELTADAETPQEDVVDIDAFAQSGNTQTAGAEQVATARDGYTDDDADADVDEIDVDALLAEVSAEEEAPAVATEQEAAAVMAETPAEEAVATEADEGEVDIDALMAEQQAVEETPAEPAQEEISEEQPEEPAAEDDLTEAVEKAMAPKQKAAAEKAPATANGVQALPAIPSAKGLQVGFPVEVLAEALRPLVQDWVAQNLPDIVERLVREEIQKLTDQE